MIAKCIVTYEFPKRAPITWRGEIEGGSPHVLANRAARSAGHALKPRNWRSISIVLERDFDEIDEVEIIVSPNITLPPNYLKKES